MLPLFWPCFGAPQFERFSLVVAYVPNSGEGLKRIDFRIGTWEPDMRAHLNALAAAGKPVLLGGDLNVAFADADIWNPEAKHVAKSAGTSPAERAAFGTLAAECALVDTFRAVHPGATGCFSYWSQRAGNRRARGKREGERFVMCAVMCAMRNARG
jgi:exodeoxyribonuclease III